MWPQDSVDPSWDVSELSDYISVRTEFLEPHPSEDYTDQFYVNQFRELESGIQRWALDMTDGYNWDETLIPDRVWTTVNFSPEFINYVEAVACDDPLFEHDWETLLRNNVQRRLLLQAMMWKILEVQVFSKALFGASARQDRMFDSADEALISLDGFPRTEIRSKSVRACLRGEILTENFYEEVDQLAGQLAGMFRPINQLNHMGGLGIGQPTIQRSYNWFQNLVSVAAYLSICIQYSPTIFSWDSAQPNDLWSMNIREPVEDIKMRSYQQYDDRTKSKSQDLLVARLHRSPRVKIAIAPGITRHKTGDGTEFSGWNAQRMIWIQDKSAVFYCAGATDANRKGGLSRWARPEMTPVPPLKRRWFGLLSSPLPWARTTAPQVSDTEESRRSVPAGDTTSASEAKKSLEKDGHTKIGSEQNVALSGPASGISSRHVVATRASRAGGSHGGRLRLALPVVLPLAVVLAAVAAAAWWQQYQGGGGILSSNAGPMADAAKIKLNCAYDAGKSRLADGMTCARSIWDDKTPYRTDKKRRQTTVIAVATSDKEKPTEPQKRENRRRKTVESQENSLVNSTGISAFFKALSRGQKGKG